MFTRLPIVVVQYAPTFSARNQNVGQQEGEKAQDTEPSTTNVVKPVDDEMEVGAVVPPSPLPHDAVNDDDDDDRDGKFTRQFLNECYCEERAWQCWHWTIEYQPYDPHSAEYVHDVEKM